MERDKGKKAQILSHWIRGGKRKKGGEGGTAPFTWYCFLKQGWE